jgi:hypothetical protein
MKNEKKILFQGVNERNGNRSKKYPEVKDLLKAYITLPANQKTLIKF